MEMHAKKSKMVAYGGILSAISVALVYLSSVLPTGRLFLMSAASVLPAVLLYKRWVSACTVSYTAVSILSLLLMPNPAYSSAYILFFGLYPLVRHAASHLRSSLKYYISLFIFSNIAIAGYYFLFTALFRIPVQSLLPLWILAALVEIGTVAYLFLYEKVVAFILKILSPLLNK